MLMAGFPVEPGKSRDLNFIYPIPQIAWNFPKTVRKAGQNKKFIRKHE